MAYRWPAGTAFKRITLDVEDCWCPVCDRHMHVCDHRYHHLCRPLQGPQMMIAMVAHVHVAVTNRTPAVLDIQSNPFEGCPSGPTIRHGRSILVLQFVDVSCREPTIT